MTVWIALLRGINLGAHNKVAMSDLREMLEALGYRDVRTHIQSGNVIFGTTGTGAELERKISARIKRELGVEIPVMVRSARQLKTVVDDNPFVRRKVPVGQLHVAFLSSQPAAAKVRTLEPKAYAPDQFEIGKQVIYLRLRDGVRGSRLPNWERVLDVSATVRTWKTVTRLLELARSY